MEYPELDKLNCSNCTERSIEIHYPEFWKYIITNYHCEKWTERLYWFYHDLKDYPKCPICGKRTAFTGLKTGYREFCSYKCLNSSSDVQNRKKETSIRNCGSPHHMQTKSGKEKVKATVREKYGVDNVFQAPDFNDKRTKTNLKKYGVEHHMQTNLCKYKVKQTNLERYGVECISQREDYKERIRQTNLERYNGTGYEAKIINDKIQITNLQKYGDKIAVKSPEISNKISSQLKRISIEKNPRILGHIDDHLWIMACPHPECNKCKEKTYISYSNRELDRAHAGLELCTKLSPINSGLSYIENFVKNILNTHNISYKSNVIGMITGRQELDIYIPEYSIAIECNGVYWHSSHEKHNKYHINKSLDCKEHNIQLIHIWEDWIKNKPHIVKSIILNKLGLINNTIYARKCNIKEIDSKTCNIFLDENHIQGRSNASIHLGLYYDDELVSVMTFSRPRVNMGAKNHKQQWELVRFCSKTNMRVVGGASKLFKHFIKEYDPDSIVSFSMNDISNGNLYKQLGFKSDEKITQSYWYIEPKTFKRYHRTSFTKQSIVKRGWRDKIDNTWTEKQVMEEMGYFCIYDSGQLKWVWER